MRLTFFFESVERERCSVVVLPPKKTQEGIRHIFLPGGASAADFVGPSRQGSDGGEKEIRLHLPVRLLLGHRGELDGTASEEKERGYSPSLSAVLRPAVQSTGGGGSGRGSAPPRPSDVCPSF